MLGQTLILNGNAYTIVGVLPASFAWGTPTLELLVPLAPDPERSRGDHRLLVIGRLKAGVTIDQAHADLEHHRRASRQAVPGLEPGLDRAPAQRSTTG